MEEARNNNQAVRVVLHPDREAYSVGELIRPRMEIQNQGETPFEASGFTFDWDALAFSGRNAAHLIAPDGQDQMLPYRRPAPAAATGPPVRVEAGKTEWFHLPISQHLRLRQFGEYVFWVELEADTGALHTSNRIGFRLDDVEPSVPPELLGLTLTAAKSSFAAGEPVALEAVFANKSGRAVVFLKPQEDSFDGWVNPVYQFTVLDGEGRSLPLARRSGSMATPVYDDAGKFTVEPGGSSPLALTLPDFPGMRKPGEYRVRLSYIVKGQFVGKGGEVLDQPMNWEEGVFTGRLESNEVTVRIG